MRVLLDAELNAVAGGWDDPNTSRDPNGLDFELSWDNGIGIGYSSGSYGFDFGAGKKTPSTPKPKKPAEDDQSWLRRIVEEALKKLKIEGSAEFSLEQKNADGSSTVIKGKVNVHNK